MQLSFPVLLPFFAGLAGSEAERRLLRPEDTFAPPLRTDAGWSSESSSPSAFVFSSGESSSSDSGSDFSPFTKTLLWRGIFGVTGGGGAMSSS